MSKLKRNDLNLLGASGRRLHEYLIKLENKVLALESVFYATNKDGSNGDLVFLSDKAHPRTSAVTAESLAKAISSYDVDPSASPSVLEPALIAVTLELYRQLGLHFEDTIAHRGSADSARKTTIETAYDTYINTPSRTLTDLRTLLSELWTQFGAHTNDGTLHKIFGPLPTTEIDALNASNNETDLTDATVRDLWVNAFGQLFAFFGAHLTGPGYQFDTDAMPDIDTDFNPYNQ